MKKTLFLVILTSLLLLNSVFALNNFSSSRGYAWLHEQQSTDGSYGNSVSQTSLAVLAYISASANDQAIKPLDWLKSQESPEYCLPKGACTIKDTALAILAFNAAGESTFMEESWLVNAQTASTTKGSWLLEVVTDGSGNCKLSYMKNNKTIVKNVTVNQGNFTASNSKFLDLNTALESNLITQNPTLDLFVDCSDISSSSFIVLIYKSSSSYHIIAQSDTSTAQLFINNGCFGLTKNSQCNYESTLYALWALSEIQSKTSPLFYLENAYDKNNIVHNAILLLVTASPAYSDALKQRQRSDGSWDSSVYNTALTILALKKHSLEPESTTKAVSYLQDAQKQDGSWNQNIQDTSISLYSSFQEQNLPTCTDGIKNGDEEGEDCGGSCPDSCDEVCNSNGECEESLGEDCDTCPADCPSCNETTECGDGSCEGEETSTNCPEDCSEESECTEDNDCDSGKVCSSNGLCVDEEDTCDNDGDCEPDDGENNEICDADCYCGDDYCSEEDEETAENCPDDCESKEEPECTKDIDCDEGEVCDSNGNCVKDTEPIVKPKKSFAWLWILLILILGILAYYFYSKKNGNQPFGFLRRSKRTPPSPPLRPFTLSNVPESRMPPNMMRRQAFPPRTMQPRRFPPLR